MKSIVSWCALLTLLASATVGRADIPASRIQSTPGMVNYQGRLTTAAGQVYSNGVYNIEFRIWDASSGGNVLWAAKYTAYVTEGYFNVMLGMPGGAAVPTNLPPPSVGTTELWKALWFDASSGNNNERFLGIRVMNDVNGDPISSADAVEAFPRQQMLCSPFAERAQMALYARAAYDTFTVGSTLSVSGTVTAAGGLTVRNSSTLTNTTVNGSMTLNQGVTVNNQQGVFNKGLYVTGATAYVKSGLDVAGATILRGGLNVVNARIQEDGKTLIPQGVIVMWSGTNAPAGWALCDGGNGTPNLRGKFIVAYDSTNTDYNATGKTGGETKHTLSVPELPAHTHPYYDWRDSDDYSEIGDDAESGGDGAGRRDNSRTTSSTGDNVAHENRPPYYVLAYIMKL